MFNVVAAYTVRILYYIAYVILKLKVKYPGLSVMYT